MKERRRHPREAKQSRRRVRRCCRRSGGNEGESVEALRASSEGVCYALFLEVMAEKADQRCSTFLLPQCGHRTSPSS